MIRIISDCGASRLALIPPAVLILSSCGGGSTATDAASAIPWGTSTIASDACGIEGTGSQIQSCIPSNDQRPPSSPTSTGTNPSGTNPVPAIISLSPDCAPQGEKSLNPLASGQLYVIGRDFVGNSVVRWNGNDRPTIFYSSSQLTAQIPETDIARVGTAIITVFNPGPGGGGSNTSSFTITAGGVSPHFVAVDPSGKFAYVANEGCGNSTFGNVSMYTINPTTGVLTPIGPPVNSNDEGASAVAVSPAGKFAYVTNWGEGDTAGGVSAYTIDATTGALTLTATTEAPCVPSPGSCAPWSIGVEPLGRFAYVANEGGFSPTSISMYTINATTGALTSTGLIAAEGRAIAVTVDPSGKFAYVANWSDPYGSAGNVSMYTIDATTGALTYKAGVAAGTTPVSVAVDPTGKSAYVTNSGSNDISMYTINATTGTLTSTGVIAAGTGPSSVVVDPSGRFAYVTNSGSNNVSMYAIDATTGTLTSTGVIAAGTKPVSVAVDSTGKFVYVANSGSNNVSVYSIDAGTGALTLVATIGT
jgi:YVTN family beta-propeller protein